jgi:tetratricopeptide (TPR) repeat protein
VERLDQANVIALKMPLLGHVVSQWMMETGILRPFLDGALDGSLTQAGCNLLARQRRHTPHYFYGLGLKSRSPHIREHCLRQLLTARQMNGQRLREAAELMIAAKAWHLLAEPAICEILLNRDEELLFQFLKPISDAGAPQVAQQVCTYISWHRPLQATLLLLSAECLHRMKQLGPAEAQARLAINSDPNRGNCHRILARILFSAGRAAEAQAAAQAGVLADPASIIGWKDLATYCKATGDTAGATPQAARGRFGSWGLRAGVVPRKRLGLRP